MSEELALDLPAVPKPRPVPDLFEPYARLKATTDAAHEDGAHVLDGVDLAELRALLAWMGQRLDPAGPDGVKRALRAWHRVAAWHWTSAPAEPGRRWPTEGEAMEAAIRAAIGGPS